MATQWTAGTTSGQVLTAATLNTIGAAWETYTPAWTSTGVAPVIGNGSVSGSWARINKTAFVNIFVVMGSTTTYGTGSYRFSVPSGVTINGNQTHVGTALLYDASAGYPGAFGMMTRVSASTFNISPSGSNETTNTAPFTWGNADQMRLMLIYQTE
jgi:hypothetical protein